MLDDNNFEYLKRVLERNEVVLFLGAGFSKNATNNNGINLPSTKELFNILWRYLGYTDDPGGSDLQRIFENALNSPKGHDSLKQLLINLLGIKDAPDWYNFLCDFYFYRIYTTNIDDLVEFIFRRSKTEILNLDTIIATNQDYRERDQFLRKIQYIKLHGCISGSPTQITFSTTQYATRAAIVHDVWYDHFVRDYATHPTLLIGTELNEPLFYQYIAVREGKYSRAGKLLNFPERRPKSFLVSPSLSQVDEEFYKNLNIVTVKATGEEFFKWLKSKISYYNTRNDIIQLRHPELFEKIANVTRELDQQQEKLTKHQITALEEFYNGFTPAPVLEPKTDYSKNYLLGYNPTWQDLGNDLDAPREINDIVKEKLEEKLKTKELMLFALIGSAGSGKSTILMRCSEILKQSGYNVFYSDGRNIPSPNKVQESLNLINQKAILLIDNGNIFGPQLPELVEALKSADNPPIVIIGSQANLYDRLERRLIGKITPKLIPVPNLSKKDIQNLLRVLSHFGLLGKLQGKSQTEQIDEFQIRAKSQILVAMKEATKGEGFDEIIEKEYKDIEPQNARILLLCVSLATSENFPLTKEQYIACSRESDFETLGYLEKNLRDIVIVDQTNHNLLITRHSLIARQIVDKVASKIDLKEAYIRLLLTLAHDFDPKFYKRTPSFRLYQLIINHRIIYERFEKALNSARDIFESIKDQLHQDWQFWLQYGSLELEYGQLDLAENYLDQAAELKPEADFIIHARAHLWLRKSLDAKSITEALHLREMAEQSLNSQFEKYLLIDPYPYHILCSQLCKWVKIWVTKHEQKVKEFEKIKEYMKEALERFPYNEKLNELNEEVNKEYLKLAIE